MKSSSTLRPWARQLLILAVTILFVGTTFPGCASRLDTAQPSSMTIVAIGDTHGYNILQSDKEQGDPLKGSKAC